MPKAKAPAGVSKSSKKTADTAAATESDENVAIPRIKLGETGYIGLKTITGRILEEQQSAFRYPNFIRTVAEMRNNPTVGAAMNVYRMMISRCRWTVEAAPDADEKDKQRAKILASMMNDMDHSWESFIESIVPYLEFGYSVAEKVFRRRLPENGSIYSDGLVGLKKLAPRSPETIARWVFEEKTTDLLGVEQSLQYVENQAPFLDKTNENGNIFIPRNKFLLFTASANKGNPEGNSIYKNVYLAHKQLTLLQEQELLGVAKDIQGILKIVAPVRYFDQNGSAEDQAVLKSFQAIIDNYNAGTQRGLLVPGLVDPETKTEMFKYELMESKGGAKHDLEACIKRLQGDVLSALNVDILKLGQDGTGSFSLASEKSSVLALAIDYRLREIQSVLNSDLVPSIYKLNGWSCENLPKFVYGDVEDISLDELGKFLQRVKSVGLLEVDRATLNRVRKAMGVKERPEDEEPDIEAMTLTDDKSRSGDSFDTDTGGLNGTSNDVSKKDNSADNVENSS